MTKKRNSWTKGTGRETERQQQKTKMEKMQRNIENKKKNDTKATTQKKILKHE